MYPILFLILAIIMFVVLHIVYRMILQKSEQSKHKTVLMLVWLPLHEWNLFWRYVQDGFGGNDIGAVYLFAYYIPMIAFSWFTKKKFMAGWYDYKAKKSDSFKNSILALSYYEDDLYIDNFQTLNDGRFSMELVYQNNGVTVEGQGNDFSVEAYATSLRPVIVPNFMLLMQSVLSRKYEDTQFQVIESDEKKKQTILFRKQISGEDWRSNRPSWEDRFSLLDIFLSMCQIQTDCVRIFNMNTAALNGPDGAVPSQTRLLENMEKISLTEMNY